MISLVINSCALGEQSRSVLSSGKQPHEQRAFALRNFILPAALADPTFSEVIVVGEWEPGNGYTYIEVPSEHFSCVDALQQRQVGFERSRGDWVVFQHDDHIIQTPEHDCDDFLGDDDLEDICYDSDNDILVPARYTRLRNVNGEKLHNGEPLRGNLVEGYISGHCAIYRREVLERCPWAEVPKQHTWDVAHTAQIRAAGFSIGWSDAMRCYDIEAGAQPWR